MTPAPKHRTDRVLLIRQWAFRLVVLLGALTLLARAVPALGPHEAPISYQTQR